MKKKSKIKTVSFLASGRGSNFEAVTEKILSGYIHAETGILITDRENAPCLEKAVRLNVDSLFINPREFSSREEHEKEMVKHLEKYKTDLIVASGFMRILTPWFINKYRGRIINIHPSLLPSFPGKNAQQQAIDYGVRISGCTTHFVDEGTDTGPIILQAPVEIMTYDDSESLSARILLEEHRILAESVRLFCEDRLAVKERIVKIKR